MIYIGLFFTSKYVLDKYCPITPIQNNCTPLTKTIIHARDGQPAVGSPYTNVFTIINTIAKNAITQNIIPNIDDNINGVVENAVIPSKAYLNNFQNDHSLFYRNESYRYFTIE